MYIEPKFVNRVKELQSLNRLVQKGSTLPIYLYGPEGCGKTRLLKEFTKSLRNVIAIYIDALESENIQKALLTTPSDILSDLVKELIKEVTKPIGSWLSERLWALIKRLKTKLRIKDKPLVIVVDDITRAIGFDRVEWYVKWLYETIKKLYEEYQPSSILIVATTSEGQSLELILRHTYATVRLIWNLDYKAFKELALQFNPPSEDLIEEAWLYTGGNPRILIEISQDYNWRIQEWFKNLTFKLTSIARQIKSKSLQEQAKYLIEDPDNVEEKASMKMEEAYKLLVEHNLFIYKGMLTLHGEEVVENLELGIGRHYAWQIPAYKMALSELI